jgi:hypothetical protein
MSSVDRDPETTSSPWALTRKSPDRPGAPVAKSRENATPEPLVSPLLPNTICWTLTAVPQSSGMPSARRYSTARLPSQEPNTARIAWRSCSRGSSGNASPVSFSNRCLKRSVSARRSSASRSVSCSTPFSPFAASIASSKTSSAMPRTTLPNICTKRR